MTPEQKMLQSLLDPSFATQISSDFQCHRALMETGNAPPKISLTVPYDAGYQVGGGAFKTTIIFKDYPWVIKVPRNNRGVLTNNVYTEYQAVLRLLSKFPQYAQHLPEVYYIGNGISVMRKYEKNNAKFNKYNKDINYVGRKMKLHDLHGENIYFNGNIFVFIDLGDNAME